MTDIHIPPAALEAGAKHIYQNWHRDSADLLPPWEFLAAEYRTRWLDQARAAFLAIVEAWPGMRVDDTYRWLSEVAIILPMEVKNAES